METPNGIEKKHKKMEPLFLPKISEEPSLSDVIDKLEELSKKIDILIKETEKNTENCEKMSSHIDFIENVYDGLRSPLGYLKWKLGYGQERQLPEIRDNQNNL